MTGAVVTPSLVPQGGPLLDAEPVLLVDDHHPEGPERDPVGEEGVGADQQVDRAVGQPGVQRGPVGRAGLRWSGGPPATDARPGAWTASVTVSPSTSSPHPGGVLFGQDLGRRHQGGLVATLDGREHGGHGHHRLARAHVPLEEPVHRAGRPARSSPDAVDGPALGGGGPEGQVARGTGPPGSAPRPGATTWWRMPRASRCRRAWRRTRASCSRNSSSKASRRRAGSLLGHRGRSVDVVEGGRPVHQAVVPPRPLGQRVGELAGPVEGLGRRTG